jgi:hypothetical protein
MFVLALLAAGAASAATGAAAQGFGTAHTQAKAVAMSCSLSAARANATPETAEAKAAAAFDQCRSEWVMVQVAIIQSAPDSVARRLNPNSMADQAKPTAVQEIVQQMGAP